jgi:23S rRNA (uracil1939-C5)-methyltransferase
MVGIGFDPTATYARPVSRFGPPPEAASDAPAAPADELIEVAVERLVAGGEALARPTDRPVVFVRGALPGERVRAVVVDRHQGFDRAEVVEVLEPSPERVVPPCAAVAAGCGGCDLQHASPVHQPELKAAVVVDALRRIGRIPEPVVELGPPLPATGFRTTLRVAIEEGRAGFRRHRSHEVVVAGACLVAHPGLDELLREGWFGGAGQATLRVGAATGERLAVIEPSAAGVELPPDVVVVGADELRRGRRAWIHDDVAGRRWRISAHSFFQSRTDGAEALVDAVVRGAGAQLAGARVVDAYAGVGLLGGAVMSRGTAGPSRLVAVERGASAIADAKVNLADLSARVVRAAVERWTPARADLVLADPSRAGLGTGGAAVVAGTGAEVVVLVSCDAASLGRDAALLAGHDFRLERAELVDLFPQSHHVEVVTRFAR